MPWRPARTRIACCVSVNPVPVQIPLSFSLSYSARATARSWLSICLHRPCITIHPRRRHSRLVVAALSFHAHPLTRLAGSPLVDRFALPSHVPSHRALSSASSPLGLRVPCVYPYGARVFCVTSSSPAALCHNSSSGHRGPFIVVTFSQEYQQNLSVYRSTRPGQCHEGNRCVRSCEICLRHCRYRVGLFVRGCRCFCSRSPRRFRFIHTC